MGFFLVIIIIRSCKSWACPTSTGKPKHIPAPPPRASSSRESSLKYSQTLQREHNPRATKRDISVQYQTQTLPLPSSKPRQRSLDSPTPLLSNSSSSSGSHASVKYEGLFFKVFWITKYVKYLQCNKQRCWNFVVHLLVANAHQVNKVCECLK